MDRIPGAKYEANERIKRMNAIRGRLFYEAKGEYVSYLDGDDFYTDDHKLQKQVDVLDADVEHKYIGCGHNGCYYWESTGKTVPIERPIRECSLTAEEYWSFLYIHTNALLLRNIGLQGIDPYKSGIPIIDNPLTFQFCPTATSTICQTACSTTARSRAAPTTAAALTRTTSSRR